MKAKHLMKNISLLIALLVGNTAQAEVMDKELSLSAVLITCTVLSTVGFLSARFKPSMLLCVVPISLFFCYGQISELQDPYVGPAIVEEAGKYYVYWSWAGIAMIFAAILIGYVFRLKQRCT